MDNKRNSQKPQNRHNKSSQNNRPHDKEKQAKERLEKKRVEFISIIKRKCSFSIDLENMKFDKECGYATKKFKIFRQGDKPWIITKGDLITWSNEKYLMIQQIEHKDSKVVERAKGEESLFDKIFGVIEQVAIEQGEKHINKMFTRRFEIQWKNITGIGD